MNEHMATYRERSDLGEYAEPKDYGTFITASTRVLDAESGLPVMVYLVPIREATWSLLDRLQDMDVPLQDRMSGAVTQWETFGYVPPNKVRHHHCGPSGVANKKPHIDRALRQFGRVVRRYYMQYGGDLYIRHAARMERRIPAWLMDGTPFTQGIVNKDGLLPYHTDRTNFDDTWSGMVAFRHKATGGYLSVPEYDVGFEIGDRSLLLFDGQHLLNGVTTMQVAPDGWRYTVVYYSRRGMVRCLTPAEEAARRANG